MLERELFHFFQNKKKKEIIYYLHMEVLCVL
jgi:hypothetical protein